MTADWLRSVVSRIEKPSLAGVVWNTFIVENVPAGEFSEFGDLFLRLKNRMPRMGRVHSMAKNL